MTMATASTSSGTHHHLPSIGCGSENLCHASYSAKHPPRENSTIETMNAYT